MPCNYDTTHKLSISAVTCASCRVSVNTLYNVHMYFCYLPMKPIEHDLLRVSVHIQTKHARHTHSLLVQTLSGTFEYAISKNVPILLNMSIDN